LRAGGAAKVYVFDEQVGGDDGVAPAASPTASNKHGGVIADAVDESVRLARTRRFRASLDARDEIKLAVVKLTL
jgi:hypothetical protein